MFRTAPLLLTLASLPATAAAQGSLNPFFQFGSGFASASGSLGDSVAIDRNGDFVAIGSSDGAFLYNVGNGSVVEISNPNFQFNGSVDIDNGRTVAGLAGAVGVFGPDGQLQDVIDRPVPSSTFGNDVAIDGDLVAIGDLGLDVNGEETAGAVFITDLTGATGPTPIQLGASLVDVGDLLGISVDVSGQRIIGGAPNLGFQDPVTDLPTAYVFDARGNTIDLGAGLITQDNAFGWSVAISGDLAIVGAISFNESPSSPFSGPGAAFVFDLANGGALVSRLSIDGLTRGDNLGFSVAIDDQTGRAVVGATSRNSPGMAYVFDAFTGDVLYELNNPTPNVRDSFGDSVDIFGDLIVVGATGVDDFGDNAGTAFFFRIPEPGTALLAMLTGCVVLATPRRR
ncbi:MAG: hypothetical protein AAGA92_11540 [Planctomycetota bacterium]